MELFSWQGDDRYYVFNLKIAEIFLCLSACMDNTIFPADEFCQFVSSLLAKVVCGCQFQGLISITG
jgi:pre-rRNA-processing protein IPI1